MNNALEVSHLTKDYGSFKLDDVSFTVPSGTIMGLIGENGAGKSTTIKCILNMLHRDGGTITVFGRDNQAEERAVKEQIGVVLDECLFHDLLHSAQTDRQDSLQPLPQLGQQAFRALPEEVRSHRKQDGKGVLPGHEDEAGHRRRLCHPAPAAHPG